MSRYTEQSDAIRAIINASYEQRDQFMGDTPYVDKHYQMKAFLEVEKLMGMKYVRGETLTFGGYD
jgi:hypothetical protein